RYRALELLVKQKRLSSTAPVPCVVRSADAGISAAEDSYAENIWREPLHPLDQFRAMKTMEDEGQGAEAIAAHFMTTPAVVRQRLRLASVSPALHEVYAQDGMTLDQLMAFSVTDDHARQEQVWELLAHGWNKSASHIRQKLTENTIRVADRRVRLVGLETYLAAGGGVMRDLFEDDDGGWLTDPAILDRLVGEKLQAEGEAIRAEGWKWVATAVDLPWNASAGLRELKGTPVEPTPEEETLLAALQQEADGLEEQWADEPTVPEEVLVRLDTIEREIGALVDRPGIYDPADMARAGVFVSVELDGSLRIERGFVRSEDEPQAATAPDHDAGFDPETGEVRSGQAVSVTGASPEPGAGGDEEEEAQLKPLPDRLVAELTIWRTVALQDAIARDPSTAFVAVLHAMVLGSFYFASHESCLQVAARDVTFVGSPPGLGDCVAARAIDERHDYWKERLPSSDKELWAALIALDTAEQANLFAHCASQTLNAQAEVVPKYDNGRVSTHSIAGRIAHSDVLARAVGLDMVAIGWRPTVDNYFRNVTKPRILADVTEARGEQFAGMIGHLKKADMAREAERLLEEAGWVPEPLRTPRIEATAPAASESAAGEDALPALKTGEASRDAGEDREFAIAAE
ncbi:ParB/RepB/Spo0J family partition protein, partial [Sphingomonas sp. OTU376]|uniref:ParB/RepB/Spo0J family partition protein n=1 Tax=Sphingomonas sp. OTU376 TaxID=3043863 RepID=UPI00313E7AD9